MLDRWSQWRETGSSAGRGEEFLYCGVQIINYNSLRSGSLSFYPPLYTLVMWSVFCIFTFPITSSPEGL